MLRQRDNVRAAQLYFSALRYSQQHRYDTLRASIYGELGDLYLHYRNIPKAIESYQNGLKQSADPRLTQRLQLKIGRAQLAAQQFKALDQTIATLRQQTRTTSAEGIQTLLLEGELDLVQQRHPQAQEKLYRAYQAAQRNHYPALSLQVLTALSTHTAQIGNYPEALRFARERLQIAQTLKDTLQIQTSILQTAQLYTQQNQLDSALQLNNRLLAEFKTNQRDTLARSIWLQRSVILERKGLIQDALSALDSLSANNADESDEEKARQRWEELTISQAEDELQTNYQRKLERQKTIRRILWISGVLIALLGIFLGLRTWQKQRANHLLQIQNQKIETQKKELEQLNQLKNRLFAIVSHDLRSPLLSLEAILNTLDELEYSEPKRQWWLSMLHQQTTKTNVLLENLLCWASIQMKHHRSEKKAIDLLSFIQEIKDNVQLMYIDKQIDITLNVPATLSLVQDEEMLRMAIRNLLINALKFSDAGQEIQVRAWSADQQVYIEIQDQGIGMTAEQLERALGGQLSRAGTRGESGNGIGLSLVRQFIEQEGGQLLGQSAPRQGTRFTIVFAESVHHAVQ